MADSGNTRVERRKGRQYSAELRAQLNPDQQMTLNELERFGWELKFIRRPPFRDPIPVVFDADRTSFCVLRPDGTLDDHPDLLIRT